MGDIIVVGLRNSDGCKGKSDGGGVVGGEVWGGKKGDKEKIQKVMEIVLERNQEIASSYQIVSPYNTTSKPSPEGK